MMKLFNYWCGLFAPYVLLAALASFCYGVVVDESDKLSDETEAIIDIICLITFALIVCGVLMFEFFINIPPDDDEYEIAISSIPFWYFMIFIFVHTAYIGSSAGGSAIPEFVLYIPHLVLIYAVIIILGYIFRETTAYLMLKYVVRIEEIGG